MSTNVTFNSNAYNKRLISNSIDNSSDWVLKFTFASVGVALVGFGDYEDAMTGIAVNDYQVYMNGGSIRASAWDPDGPISTALNLETTVTKTGDYYEMSVNGIPKHSGEFSVAENFINIGGGTLDYEITGIEINIDSAGFTDIDWDWSRTLNIIADDDPLTLLQTNINNSAATYTIPADTYHVTRPLEIDHDCHITATDAILNGSGISRIGSSPDAIFHMNGCANFACTGGTFKNGHLIKFYNNMNSVHLDVEEFSHDTGDYEIAICPTNASFTADITNFTVKAALCERTNGVYSSSITGNILDVQLTECNDFQKYLVRVRDGGFFNIIKLHDSVIDGIHDPTYAAQRVMQSAAKRVFVNNVTMQNITSDTLTSLVYWSNHDLFVDNCTVQNVSSSGDERWIESKSTDNYMVTVTNSNFDSTGISPSVSVNHCIDTKGRRFKISGCTFTNITGAALYINSVAGEVQENLGQRVFTDNTIITSKYPTVISIGHSSTFPLRDIVIKNNIVTNVSNPADIELGFSDSCSFINISATRNESLIKGLTVHDNDFTCTATGDCAFIRFNLYDTDADPSNFLYGNAVKTLKVYNNTATLSGGSIFQMRNGQTTSIYMSNNSFTGNTYITTTDFIDSELNLTYNLYNSTVQALGNYAASSLVSSQNVILPINTADPNNIDRIKTQQQARHYPISSIDYVSGDVTWGPNVGDSYVLVASTGTDYIDNVYTSTSNASTTRKTSINTGLPRSVN